MTLASIPSPSTAVWHLGPFPVRAYALCIVVGIIAAAYIAERRMRDRGAPQYAILDVAIWAVPFGIVGARIYNVITSYQVYFGKGGTGALSTLYIWQGGLGIWGAVAGGALGAWIGCRRLRIPLTFVADCLETIEEIGIEVRDEFLHAGGKAFHRIPCLNASPSWIKALGEIVAQFRAARRWAAAEGYGPISNIVYMGMGEPLSNRAAVMPSLTILNQGYAVGARRITVSTVGVVPGILELAQRPEQFRLALSLHSPDSDLRKELIPLEKRHPLPELMEALRTFDAAGGKRITNSLPCPGPSLRPTTLPP